MSCRLDIYDASQILSDTMFYKKYVKNLIKHKLDTYTRRVVQSNTGHSGAAFLCIFSN